jgi:hypothetical protein
MKKPEPRQPGLLPMRSPRRKMPDRSRRNAKNQHPGKDEFPHGFLLRLQHRKGPTLARIEQHAFKRKCPLALNSIANKYWSNRESNDYLSLVRTDLANGSNKRSTGQNTRIRS